MSQNISDLRAVMFDVMAGLKDKTITVEQARAMSEIGKVVIDSAKVEVDYLRVNNGGEAPFLEAIGDSNLPVGIVGRTIHRIK